MIGLGLVIVGAVLMTLSSFTSMSETDQRVLYRLWLMTVAGWLLLAVGSVLAAAEVVNRAAEVSYVP